MINTIFSQPGVSVTPIVPPVRCAFQFPTLLCPLALPFRLSTLPIQAITYSGNHITHPSKSSAWGSAHPAKLLRQTTFGLLETISPSGALPNIMTGLSSYPPQAGSPVQPARIPTARLSTAPIAAHGAIRGDFQ